MATPSICKAMYMQQLIQRRESVSLGIKQCLMKCAVFYWYQDDSKLAFLKLRPGSKKKRQSWQIGDSYDGWQWTEGLTWFLKVGRKFTGHRAEGNLFSTNTTQNYLKLVNHLQFLKSFFKIRNKEDKETYLSFHEGKKPNTQTDHYLLFYEKGGICWIPTWR